MILLWDSSKPIVQLIIVLAGERFSYEWKADRSLAKDMLAYLREVMAEHGKTLTDIEGIGVLRGPGSFTGLRIGMTVLNTLADTLAVPIVGVEGLDWQDHALARIAAGENDRIVLPAYGAEAHVTKPRK